MLDSHRVCQRKDLHAPQGLTASQSAHALALEPRPVASWLRHERCRPRPATPRARLLAPLQPQRVQRLDKDPSSAPQGLQRRRAQGFAGGSSSGKADGRTVRPTRQPALLTLAWAPGAWAQVAWGSCGSVPVGHTSRRLRFLVLVRCSSRMMDVECTVSPTMEPFLAGHQPACAGFGGMPKTVRVDTLPSAVRTRVLGEAPVCKPPSLDGATHCGVTLAPCHVGKGKEKGRVEHGGGSVNKPGLAGLELPACSALPPAARQWLDTVAPGRLHRDPREKPVQAWHTARPSRSSLPMPPFESATVAQVRAARQCRLTLATNPSAVPAPSAAQALPLTTAPDRRGLSHGDTLRARHTRRDDRWQEVADPAPPPPRLEQRQKARDHPRFLRFLARSPRAEASALHLAERRLHPHHHVRHLVALSDIDDPQTVARAREDAWTYEAFSSAYLANLLEQRARCTPEARAFPLTRRAALLEVRRPPPDLSLYQATP